MWLHLSSSLCDDSTPYFYLICQWGKNKDKCLSACASLASLTPFQGVISDVEVMPRKPPLREIYNATP